MWLGPADFERSKMLLLTTVGGESDLGERVESDTMRLCQYILLP